MTQDELKMYVIEAPGDYFVVRAAGPGDEVVRVGFDGTVTVNPKYTVDEAARAFWDAVMKTAGTWRRIA